MKTVFLMSSLPKWWDFAPPSVYVGDGIDQTNDLSFNFIVDVGDNNQSIFIRMEGIAMILDIEYNLTNVKDDGGKGASYDFVRYVTFEPNWGEDSDMYFLEEVINPVYLDSKESFFEHLFEVYSSREEEKEKQPA